MFPQDGLSIPFFNIGMNISRNVSLTRTLTNPLRTPDWLLGTNRNPTVPRQLQPEDSVVQNVQTTHLSPEDIQSKQSDKQIAAVTIDIHETSGEDIEAGKKLATRWVRDTTPNSTSLESPTPDTLEEDTLEKLSTTPNSSENITKGSGLMKASSSKSPRTVQFSSA
jgi:hypothetical protein